MNDLILAKELTGLTESKAAQIKAVFQPMVKMLEGFESEYREVMAMPQSVEKIVSAKKLRISIAKVRVNADKARKSLKEECLREGNAIQGTFNLFKFGVAEMEEKLKNEELHYEKIETERINHIRAERTAEAGKYDLIGQLIRGDSHTDYGIMTDDVWFNYLAGLKANHKAAEDAQRKAEQERIEAERKNKIWHERTAKLAGYAQFEGHSINLVTSNMTEPEFQKILSCFQNKKKAFDEEQAAIRLENEKLRAQQKKMEAERAAREAELAKEIAAREKIEKENKEKIAQEQKEIAARDFASDKEKLLHFADMLMYQDGTFKSKEAETAMTQSRLILVSTANKCG